MHSAEYSLPGVVVRSSERIRCILSSGLLFFLFFFLFGFLLCLLLFKILNVDNAIPDLLLHLLLVLGPLLHFLLIACFLLFELGKQGGDIRNGHRRIQLQRVEELEGFRIVPDRLLGLVCLSLWPFFALLGLCGCKEELLITIFLLQEDCLVILVVVCGLFLFFLGLVCRLWHEVLAKLDCLLQEGELLHVWLLIQLCHLRFKLADLLLLCPLLLFCSIPLLLQPPLLGKVFTEFFLLLPEVIASLVALSNQRFDLFTLFIALFKEITWISLLCLSLLIESVQPAIDLLPFVQQQGDLCLDFFLLSHHVAAHARHV